MLQAKLKMIIVGHIIAFDSLNKLDNFFKSKNDTTLKLIEE